MKNFLFLSLAFLFSFSLPLKSESIFPITDVTVYRSGATVHRTDDIKLAAGDNLIEITGLPYQLNLATTQISIDPSVKVLSIRSENDISLNQSASEQTILKDSIRLYEAEEKMLLDQIEILKKNNKLSSQIGANYAEELRKLMDYYISENKKLTSELFKIQRIKKELQQEVQLLDSQNITVKEPGLSHKKKLIVGLYSEKAINSEMVVSYFTQQAGWSTEYDLYMTDLKEDLTLLYKGKIWNKTNETWPEVGLTLTTAMPHQSINAAELQDWWLRELNPYPSYARGKEKGYYIDGVRVNEDLALDAANARSNFRRQAAADADTYKAESDKSYLSQYSEQITATVFELDRKHTVQGQATDYTLILSEQNIEADYYYKCTPKLSQYAYLYANVKNADDLLLSQGSLTVFAQGRMQGKTYLNPHEEKEDFEIPLGVDYGVAIQRERIKEYNDVKFLRQKVRKEIGYKISVKNNKTSGIDIEIHDQLPLSTSDKIKVEDVEVSGAEINEENGRIIWKVKLDKNAFLEKIIKYVVEQPKGMNLGI